MTETTTTLADLIEEYGPAFEAYANNVGEDYADAEGFEEAYRGVWKDEEDFAFELANDCGMLPKDPSWPLTYIDWERAARDLFMDDYWSADAGNGNVYVFQNI